MRFHNQCPNLNTNNIFIIFKINKRIKLLIKILSMIHQYKMEENYRNMCNFQHLQQSSQEQREGTEDKLFLQKNDHFRGIGTNKSTISEEEGTNLKLISEVICKNGLQIPHYTSLDQQNLKDFIGKLRGGCVNDVYQIGPKYVIKIQNELTNVLLHQVQLHKLAKQAGIKVPQYIDYGTVLGKNYLLTTKLQGDQLWRYWPLLTEEQRQNLIAQICIYLKKLHSIKFGKYCFHRTILPHEEYQTMYEAICAEHDKLLQLVWQQQKVKNYDQKTLENLQLVTNFMEQNKHILKQEQGQQHNPVFIHNDFHLGNVIYDIKNHQITGLIDFDFSRQLNKTYELWEMILEFTEKITEFKQQDYSISWKNYAYTNQMEYFKKYYPQLFHDPKGLLYDKIRVHYVRQMLIFLDYEKDPPRFNEFVDLLYRTTWLQEYLKLDK